jgi:hypothetical protein
MPNDIVKSSMDNEIVKKLAWSAMLTAGSALASLLAARLMAVVYRQMFDEDPPD